MANHGYEKYSTWYINYLIRTSVSRGGVDEQGGCQYITTQKEFGMQAQQKGWKVYWEICLKSFDATCDDYVDWLICQYLNRLRMNWSRLEFGNQHDTLVEGGHPCIVSSIPTSICKESDFNIS